MSQVTHHHQVRQSPLYLLHVGSLFFKSLSLLPHFSWRASKGTRLDDDTVQIFSIFLLKFSHGKEKFLQKTGSFSESSSISRGKQVHGKPEVLKFFKTNLSFAWQKADVCGLVAELRNGFIDIYWKLAFLVLHSARIRIARAKG